MSLKFIILGCGSSLGVPRADGDWGKCDPNEKKNYRTRCSALIKFNNMNILLDTSPDLRTQLIKNNIKNINYVIYSHKHADQVHGINDLRVFSIINKKKINVYADKETRKYLYDNFNYCFEDSSDYKAILKLNKIKKNFIFKNNKRSLSLKTIPVEHGIIQSQAFIINKSCAYISDANKIHKKDFKYFKKLNYFIVDCLRINEHPSHFNLDDVIKLTNILRPKKTILTNLHSALDYKYLIKSLPKNIFPAYDGMSLNI
jgi:phosphoribosyl 1,2-cyclic phosphate phosphodiesterase